MHQALDLVPQFQLSVPLLDTQFMDLSPVSPRLSASNIFSKPWLAKGLLSPAYPLFMVNPGSPGTHITSVRPLLTPSAGLQGPLLPLVSTFPFQAALPSTRASLLTLCWAAPHSITSPEDLHRVSA